MNISKWQLKLLIKAISFPSIMTLSSMIPGLNSKILFAHAGIGHFMLALSLPWVVGVIVVDIKRNYKMEFKKHMFYGGIILVLYLLFIYPLSIIFQQGMLTMGQAMELNDIYGIYLIPISFF